MNKIAYLEGYLASQIGMEKKAWPAWLGGSKPTQEERNAKYLKDYYAKDDKREAQIAAIKKENSYKIPTWTPYKGNPTSPENTAQREADVAESMKDYKSPGQINDQAFKRALVKNTVIPSKGTDFTPRQSRQFRQDFNEQAYKHNKPFMSTGAQWYNKGDQRIKMTPETAAAMGKGWVADGASAVLPRSAEPITPVVKQTPQYYRKGNQRMKMSPSMAAVMGKGWAVDTNQ